MTIEDFEEEYALHDELEELDFELDMYYGDELDVEEDKDELEDSDNLKK